MTNRLILATKARVGESESSVQSGFGGRGSDRAFRLPQRFHVLLLLTLSLIAIAGATLGCWDS